MSLLTSLIRFTLILLCLAAPNSFAASATWRQNPQSSDWNTAANWTPQVVPNGSNDIATFSVTNEASISLSGTMEVSEMNFLSGAAGYVFSIPAFTTFTLSGPGVVNSSPATQQFALSGNEEGFVGGIVFVNQANAGSLASYDLQGGRTEDIIGTYAEFLNDSSAGSATFLLRGPTDNGNNGANIIFVDDATADHATITSEGSAADTGAGGQIFFTGRATAAFANIVNEGGSGSAPLSGSYMLFQADSRAGQATITMKAATNSAGGGGQVLFLDNSTADGATLVAEDGYASGAAGGAITFYSNSLGGTSRLELFGNGVLDLRFHNPASVTFGSIEGSGVALIGNMSFQVGFNNLATTFSGVIDDGGAGGVFYKEGSGTLTLSGPNNYSGGTVIDDGTLIVTTKGVSPTGSGDVTVNHGTLSGTSRLSGGIVVGSGNDEGAFLAPGVNGIGTLTTGQSLLLSNNSTYLCEIDAKRARADSLRARGVRILNESTFTLISLNQRRLAIGASFVVINNTSAHPISGTFANLPDQGTIIAGRNTFQANYAGGDGNDLSLTVIP